MTEVPLQHYLAQASPDFNQKESLPQPACICSVSLHKLSFEKNVTKTSASKYGGDSAEYDE
jgi:hypothetical protein